MRRIFHLTYPLFLGYVSVGFVFGVLASGQGFPPLFVLLSSVFVYAGASQFLLLNLITGGTSILQVFIAVLLLNLRHLFYFKPVEKLIPESGFKRWYSALTMTDESFALMCGGEVKREETFASLMTLHGYWISATVLGAVLGGGLAKHLQGLEFSLIALFTVLAIEKLNWMKDRVTLIASLVVCLALWWALPADFFLITAIALCLAMAAFIERKPHAH